MLSLSDNNQTYVVEAFNSTSRYSDACLYIDYPNFELMVSQIYPNEHQLDKANSSDTETPFWTFSTNVILSTKFYDKRDDCNI